VRGVHVHGGRLDETRARVLTAQLRGQRAQNGGAVAGQRGAAVGARQHLVAAQRAERRLQRARQRTRDGRGLLEHIVHSIYSQRWVSDASDRANAATCCSVQQCTRIRWNDRCSAAVQQCSSAAVTAAADCDSDGEIGGLVGRAKKFSKQGVPIWLPTRLSKF
jgi:hypothetical protein